jgi:hypothetical protein
MPLKQLSLSVCTDDELMNSFKTMRCTRVSASDFAVSQGSGRGSCKDLAASLHIAARMILSKLMA